MKKKVEKKVVKQPKVKFVVAEENTPVSVDVDTTESTASVNSIFHEPEKVVEEVKPEEVKAVRKAFQYPIPETREDYLALHKCLKDLGVNSTSDLEVRASRL